MDCHSSSASRSPRRRLRPSTLPSTPSLPPPLTGSLSAVAAAAAPVLRMRTLSMPSSQPRLHAVVVDVSRHRHLPLQPPPLGATSSHSSLLLLILPVPVPLLPGGDKQRGGRRERDANVRRPHAGQMGLDVEGRRPVERVDQDGLRKATAVRSDRSSRGCCSRCGLVPASDAALRAALCCRCALSAARLPPRPSASAARARGSAGCCVAE